MKNMKLLELPEELILEILNFCKDGSLIKITEVCRRLKNMVEATPRLMSRIKLSFRTCYGVQRKYEKDLFKICLKSARKYLVVLSSITYIVCIP